MQSTDLWRLEPRKNYSASSTYGLSATYTIANSSHYLQLLWWRREIASLRLAAPHRAVPKPQTTRCNNWNQSQTKHDDDMSPLSPPPVLLVPANNTEPGTLHVRNANYIALPLPNTQH
ncbi:hypothetical protein J6590_005866 [Homalodisca vitripennis]|nr:hypothetical protein J6590_005866 [Homalodisca vitripennis]